MPSAKYFTVVDAKQAFYHIPLEEKSSYLTCFGTPFGRYRYLRMPMGISSASEVYQCAMEHLLAGYPCLVIVDDILVYGATEEEHDDNLKKVLQRLREINLKLTAHKCQYKLQEVPYIGHVLSKDGLKPDPEKVRAISDMPTPNDATGLLRFPGMVKYLAKFVRNLSEKAAPLNELLRKDRKWQWDQAQQHSFDEIKKSIAQVTNLAYFDVKKGVTLTCDASQSGLGAACLQDGNPVAYASRALTQAETRYAQIEKELLAVVFACTRFRDFVFGKTVTIETDHQPLVSIVKIPLSAAPARLQRLLLKLQSYRFNLVYKKGSDLFLADTLSRAYLPYKESDREDTQDYEIMSVLPISSKKLVELKEATAKDVTLQKVHRAIVMGWSKKETELRPFYPVRDELIEDDGVILKGHKIVVPKSLQKEYVDLAHSGHLGAEATKRRARDILYWPSMSRDIDDVVAQCSVCHSTRSHQSKEPLQLYPVPSRRWATLGTDLFEWHGKMYLVTVDSYSGWFEMNTLLDTSTTTVVQKLKSHFARFGIPDMVISDSGSQFTSREFKNFATAWGFNHTMSSPHFHSSNGLAEKAVQTAKKLLEKSFRDGTDPYLNLLNWRNTPRDSTLGSPAQRNLSCRTMTTIPSAEALLKPEVLDPERIQHQLSEKRQQQKQHVDKSAKSLIPLQTGDSVRMQTAKGYDKLGSVVKLADEPRSYWVESKEGRQYRRNRRHLLKVPQTPAVPAIHQESPTRQMVETPTTSTAASKPTSNTLQATTTQDSPKTNTTGKPKPVPEPGGTPKTTRSGRTVTTPERYRE
jgi:transposase InsO family protein